MQVQRLQIASTFRGTHAYCVRVANRERTEQPTARNAVCINDTLWYTQRWGDFPWKFPFRLNFHMSRCGASRSWRRRRRRTVSIIYLSEIRSTLAASFLIPAQNDRWGGGASAVATLGPCMVSLAFGIASRPALEANKAGFNFAFGPPAPINTYATLYVVIMFVCLRLH